MSPADMIASGAAAVCAVATIAGTIYNRGRLDAHSKATTEALGDVKKQLEAMQGERSTIIKDTAVLEVRLNTHEAGCRERQGAIEKRFDTVDRSLENLFGQVRNLAVGLAPRAMELPANTPRRQR